MKKLLLGMTILFSISSFAHSVCVDRRAAFIAPCNKKLFFVQGRCHKPYEFESLYCATPGKPVCADRRAAFIQPCRSGEKIVFVQGQCPSLYDFEHVYCRKAGPVPSLRP